MAENGTANERRNGGKSLQRNLALWFSIIVVLSCLSVGSLGTYLRAEGMREKLFSQLEGMRDHAIQSLGLWFDERSADVAALATEPSMIDLAQRNANGEQINVESGREQLRRVQQAYGYHAVFLADPVDGKTFMSADESVGNEHRLSNEHFSRSLTSARSYVSDVFRDGVHDRPELIVAHKVVDDESGVLGIAVIQIDVLTQLLPLITASERLGETDELVLVNRDRIAQTPLRHNPDAALNLIINAEPATRGASGETGKIQIEDYRKIPVMAAYGHIPETHWGLVAKQDLAEFNRPIMNMAKTMAIVSVCVLVIAAVIGLFIAKRIARPMREIADVAERIGDGDLAVRAVPQGPTETRQVARSLNVMVERLSAQVRKGADLSRIYAAAGAHHRLEDLLDETIPLIVESTGSDAAVTYVSTEEDERVFECIHYHGLNARKLPHTFTVPQHDYWLAQAAESGKVRLLKELPDNYELALGTHVGNIRFRTLMAVPLASVERVIAVIGLASVHDYTSVHSDLGEALSLNMAASFIACMANGRAEKTSAKLAVTNSELLQANHRLENQSKELRKQAEELEARRVAIQEMDRLKSEFLSNMSHELRTPLNSVLALSQLMIGRGAEVFGADNLGYLQIIERNGRQLLSLIDDILDLAKIESGRMQVTCTTFSCREVIGQIVSTIQPLAEEKGLGIRIRVDDLELMRSDEDKVRQILLNLVSNAVKFTDRGSVFICATGTDESISVSVQDTGCGIPEEALPRIFDEFRQVDGTATRRHQGTGLGLAICQRLAGVLGGDIAVESQVGKGSTFTVHLPLRCPIRPDVFDRKVDRLDIRSQVRPCRPSFGTLLIVEDEDVDANQIKAALEECGHHAHIAMGGQEALDFLDREMPTGVILDLLMPDTDGFTVLEYMRSDPQMADVPVFVLTAKVLNGEEEGLLTKQNVQQVVRKGTIDKKELAANISAMIGEHRNPATKISGVVGDLQPSRKDSVTSHEVLIVEDNPDNMRTALAILEQAGVRCLQAEDGETAIEMVRRHRPGLVFMDVALPGVSGLQATRAIKAESSLAAIPVVALTARAMKGDRETILSAGCDDYLAKPVDPHGLVAMVHKWLPPEVADDYARAEPAGASIP